jgi:hypothetical protein
LILYGSVIQTAGKDLWKSSLEGYPFSLGDFSDCLGKDAPASSIIVIRKIIQFLKNFTEFSIFFVTLKSRSNNYTPTNMATKKPTSFKVFLLVISVVAAALGTATLFSYFQVDKKYSMSLTILIFVAMSFANIGIYTGFKDKNQESGRLLNRIGLVGNIFAVVVFLFFMFMVLLTYY